MSRVQKLNRTFLLVVRFLVFIISDAAFVHNKADEEGGFNSWTKTYALGKKFGLNSLQSSLQNFDI